MDRRTYQASSCDSLNNTAQEPQWDLQIFTPIMKQETVQCFDEENRSQCINREKVNCSNYMFPYKQSQSSNCINYYDNQFCVSEEVKKEFPEDECPQSSSTASCINKFSIDSEIVLENEELSKVVQRQEIKQENTDKTLSFIKREEISDKKNKFIVKTEMSEEQSVFHNAGDRSIIYEVPITPQVIQPEMCDGILKNNSKFLKHNNKHIKVEPTLVGNEGNELHKCQYCDEYFNNDNMFAHVRDAHSNDIPKVDLGHENTKPSKTGKNGKEMTHKCDLCDRIYKSKGALVSHIKKIHYDYGTLFKCWCGEQFRSPIHLYQHKYKRHGFRTEPKKKDKFQCDFCRKIYKTKDYLVKHIKCIHYDYGKIFLCWCGKQFRAPIYLYKHKHRQHNTKVKITNEAALKTEFQCDICKKIFKKKRGLIIHITSIHYDYGKKFECWCGKQFRTPRHLYTHKSRQHGTNVKKTNLLVLKTEFQCDICKKYLKTRKYLISHIRNIHYDYGGIFECRCGKQFRSPKRLKVHEREQHKCISNSENKNIYRCEYCEAVFKVKRYLAHHVKRMHR